MFYKTLHSWPYKAYPTICQPCLTGSPCTGTSTRARLGPTTPYARGRPHGRRKDFFQGGAPGDFSKLFQGGAKYGEICFFSLETKKTTFFVEIFKIQGEPRPLPASPSNAHGRPHKCFQEEATSTLCLSFSSFWRRNVNEHSQNALPLLRHKRNPHVTVVITKDALRRHQYPVQYDNLHTRPAMSNPNGLLSQKLCHYRNKGRTLNDRLMRAAYSVGYFDLNKVN